MNPENLPAHLVQANSWKRLLHERLQSFSQWDDKFQMLSNVEQSALYKARQQLLSDTFHIANLSHSYQLIIDTRDRLAQRLADTEHEINGLQSKAPQEESAAVKQARASLRVMVEHYNSQALSLETSHRLLQSQRSALLAPIELGVLRKHVDVAYEALQRDRLRLTIGRTVAGFLDDVDSNMQHLECEIERVNIVLISIYGRSEQYKSNAGSLAGKLFNINKQRNQLRQLYKKSAEFNLSLANMFTAKEVLMDRFMNRLVQGVRAVYLDLNQAIELWIKEALSSLVQTHQYQKHMIDNQKQRLAQLQREGCGSQAQIAALRTQANHLQVAQFTLQPLYDHAIASRSADNNRLAAVVHEPVVSLQEVRQAVAVN